MATTSAKKKIDQFRILTTEAELYALLSSYEKITAKVKNLEKKKCKLAEAIHEACPDAGTVQVRDITLKKQISVANILSKPLITSLLKAEGRMDLIDAATTESPRQALYVTRIDTLLPQDENDD